MEVAIEGEDSEMARRADAVRALYLKAYRRGALGTRVVDPLATGTFWPRLFLEHPDTEAVSRTVGRYLRGWLYAILDESLGLPASVAVESGEDATDEVLGSEESDQEELVDVEEESDEESDEEDLLGPLKGALHDLHGSGDREKKLRSASETASAMYEQHKGPKFIMEYVRRGTRAVPEVVQVPKLPDLLASISLPLLDPNSPLSLQSEDVRLTMLLRILESDIPAVRAVDSMNICAVLSLRWVVRTMHTRAVESGRSREREAERWTRNEARAFLASLGRKGEGEAPPPLINRNIQLVAQVLMALSSVGELAQVLLLAEAVPLMVAQFSGRAFHVRLTASVDDQPEVPAVLWDAVEKGLEGAFVEEKRKSKSGKKDKVPAAKVAPPTKAPSGSRTRFGLLAEE